MLSYYLSKLTLKCCVTSVFRKPCVARTERLPAHARTHAHAAANASQAGARGTIPAQRAGGQGHHFRNIHFVKRKQVFPPAAQPPLRTLVTPGRSPLLSAGSFFFGRCRFEELHIWFTIRRFFTATPASMTMEMDVTHSGQQVNKRDSLGRSRDGTHRTDEQTRNWFSGLIQQGDRSEAFFFFFFRKNYIRHGQIYLKILSDNLVMAQIVGKL